MATDNERLVLQMSADLRSFEREMARARSVTEARMREVERAALRADGNLAKAMEQVGRNATKSLEKGLSGSSGAIANSLKGAAATIGAGVSVGAVKNLADGYSRFTNQLRVAGLEGAALAKTQEDLFAIAQKYGVELEALGTLYGRNGAAAKELNLSEAQQLTLTRAVAASLRIQGGDAQASAGALLQLSQALGGSKIQAQEYNSLIDGMRPLLQGVAAASDKYKGSVAALTADVKDGNVSTAEFARLILAASSALETKASTSVLTISASLQILNNALGQYVGQTDASLSATQRVSEAIIRLADNLDKIIPAITVLATLIGGRYVAALGVKTAATVASTVADVRAALAVEALAAANARLTISGGAATASMARATASVSGYAVAAGVATRGAGGLAAMLGGPVGVAITAVVAGLALLVVNSTEAAQEARAVQRAHEKLDPVLALVTASLDKAATASGRLRAQHLAAADAAYLMGDAELESSRKALAAAQARLAAIEAERKARNAKGYVTPSADLLDNASASGEQGLIERLRREIRAQEDLLVKYGFGRRVGPYADGPRFERILPSQSAEAKSSASSTAPVGETAEQKKARLKAEREAAAAARKAESDRLQGVRADKSYDADLRRAQSDLLEAQVDASNIADERLRLEKERLGFARDQRLQEIAADGPEGTKKYTADEVAKLQELERRTTAQKIANLDAADLERVRADNARIAQAELDASTEAAQLAAELATTAKDRRAAELRLLDLSEQRERADAEAIIASRDATDVEKEIARRRLRTIGQTRSAREQGILRDTAGPMEDYLNSIPRTVDEVNEAMQRLAVDGLESLSTGLADAIVNAKDLGDVAKSVFRQMIADMLAASIQKNALDPLLRAGLGFLTGGRSGIGGHEIGHNAGGTDNWRGGLSVVGERGPEILNIPRGGQVIPNDVLKALATMKTPSRAAAPIIHSPNYNLQGAVLTPEIWNEIKAVDRRAQAGIAGLAGAMQQGDKTAGQRLGARDRLRG